MERVYEFLKKCGTYYLATVDAGKPRVRPFGTVDIFENRLYIQMGKSKEVFRQITENPYVEICAFDGEKWLRAAGSLVYDDRRDARKHMLDAYPMLRSMYDEDDGNTAVMYFEHAECIFSSFAAPCETVVW